MFGIWPLIHFRRKTSIQISLNFSSFFHNVWDWNSENPQSSTFISCCRLHHTWYVWSSVQLKHSFYCTFKQQYLLSVVAIHFAIELPIFFSVISFCQHRHFRLVTMSSAIVDVIVGNIYFLFLFVSPFLCGILLPKRNCTLFKSTTISV